VGRDTQGLDESGIARAAIESLAESFNDGVVAPAFWLSVAGLPGLFAYKAVNTADSMVGHKTALLRKFGWASARVDDVLNWIPARLAAVLIVGAARRGWRIALRDGHNHESPNAGWPEAAMAGALECRLGGLNWYDGEEHRQALLGDGLEPCAADLSRAMAIYRRAAMLLFLVALSWGAYWQA
jgi:adenosylcobinamide-phosphate synthase